MTTSTPPAWHFLHECDAPVTMAELSVHSHNLPVADVLSERNDSDQCSECRSAPGQSHAPRCDVSQTGNFPATGNIAHVESCPECGTVTDIEYGTVKDKSLDCQACEPEPARSAIGAGPLFAAICDEVRVPDEWPETGNPLHAHMRATFDACLAISVAKNADYAGDEDPLANFRECEKDGVPLIKGILVRIGDKRARMRRLLNGHEAQVADEKLTDTIHDKINYLAIVLYAMETET